MVDNVQVNAGQDQTAQAAENAKRDDVKPHIPNQKSPQNMEHVQAVAEKLESDKLLRSASSIKDELNTGEGKTADELVQSTKDAEAEEVEKAKDAAAKQAGTSTDVESDTASTDTNRTAYDDGDSTMSNTDKSKQAPKNPGKQSPGDKDKSVPKSF